jgi:steroid 5-alpha reductase family enzyme
LTEYITQNKYPEYKEYKKQVRMFLPSLKPYQPPKGQIKGKSQ